jgi:NAD-dependent dihydropyrimidine dehydrogenase PreA subunit
VPACEREPGVIYPVVDLKRCEGKGDCERVCPENVFEVKRIDEQDYRSLGVLHRFKLRVHGFKVAYTQMLTRVGLADCASLHAPNTPLR